MNDLRGNVGAELMRRPGTRRRGREIEFLCVAHDEHTASASFNTENGAWNCRAARCGVTGTTRDLAERLGLPVPEQKRFDDIEARVSATYDYVDEDGRLIFQAVRLHSPKDFFQRRPNGAGGWINNIKGCRRVLYRLPELLALPAGSLVFVCEGEKDVENLRAEGFNATCNPMGAEKFSVVDASVLGPHHVVTLVDRDEAGDRHGEQVAKLLYGKAASLKIVQLPGLQWRKSHGPDVSDWLAMGNSASDLTQVVEQWPDWVPPEAPVGLAGFEPTNAGHAEAFAFLYGPHARYDHARDRWLVWLRHRWGQDPDGMLWRMALDTSRKWQKAAADITNESRASRLFKFAKETGESTAGINAMLKAAQNTPPFHDAGVGWDSQATLLGCENGVYNLVTGEFRDGRRDDRITLSTGLYADPNAKCPRWLQFLDEVFIEAEIVAFIKRAVGYTLTGSSKEQVWFLCHGSGANGKSTFIDTVYRLLGEYGGDTPAETICGRGSLTSGQASPDVAQMQGKRMVMCSETEEMARINAGRMKWITGGNPITARVLYSNPVTFKPEAKIWLSTNHLPRVEDDSDGFWRRVRLIPFLRSFEGSPDKDPALEEKLAVELPGILAWAVEGAVEWMQTGLKPPTSVMKATWDYRQSSDPIAEFIATCCVVGEGPRATRGQLFKAYSDWADREGMGGNEKLGLRAFGNRISARFEQRKSMDTRWYVGIGLRAEEDGDRDVRDVTRDAMESASPKPALEGFSNPSREKKSGVTSLTSLTSLSGFGGDLRGSGEIAPAPCEDEECALDHYGWSDGGLRHTRENPISESEWGEK